MTAIKRRRLVFNGIRTLLLTLVVVIAQAGGLLQGPEHLLYDLRTRFCQWHAPKPTDRLVHLDIDENALSQIGHWPWSREKLADILDEVRIAGPKVLAMDILFAEPAQEVYDREGKPVNRDQTLADSIAKLGGVLVPTSFRFATPCETTPLDQKLIDLIAANPEITADECFSALSSSGGKSAAFQADVAREFVAVRPRGLFERIFQEMDRGAGAAAPLKQKLLPHSDPLIDDSLQRLFDEQYVRAERERSLLRFTIPAPPGIPPVLKVSEAVPPITPILSLSTAARYSAFVDYAPDAQDGTVRSVPLVVSYRGRLMPQMGLVTACAQLDVDVRSLRFSPDKLILPRPGGDIAIPVRTRTDTALGPISMLMEIPMFGKKGNPLTMYDYPRHQATAQHVPIYEIWRICMARKRLAENDRQADVLVYNYLKVTDADAANAYAASPSSGPAKRALIEKCIADLEGLIAPLSKSTELDDDGKKYLQGLRTSQRQLRDVINQNSALRGQIDGFRAAVHDKLNGKAVFLSGIGTGHVDTIRTSLQPDCPGVIVHGAIFNAILTGKMWRVADRSVTLLLTVALGLLTGIVVATLHPIRASFAAATLIAAYLVINGVVLFDYGNLIVGVAGPVFAATLVWAGVTVTNFIAEAAERSRITHRFSNYVDPSLVNYVLEHPEQARFDGESREMTMGFTDLAGFTALTETLGPKTVPLLAEYMGLMIPPIRAHKGYVSRLMGDGIYFFFGAPEPDADHAAHAVSTVLAMHQALDQLNATLPQRGLPELRMRAGLCTGRVIVGDAGSREFSDYTAIGDPVNTASRFEAANKVFGTRILASARTIELLNGRFLVRPIANLRVMGKTEGIVVYEPLSLMETATNTQRQLAEQTTQMVDAFRKGEFCRCLELIKELNEAFGATRLTAFYSDFCQACMKAPIPNFNGQVVLTEK